MRIDAHQHFWRYNEHEYGWISEEMGELRRDWLPEDLLPLLEGAGFEGTVAVEARQTLQETTWLLGLAERHRFVRGVVGWVDLCSPLVVEDLARLAENPLLRGVRHVLQDEADPHFALRDDFCRGIGLLETFGLTYDILIYANQLPVACELVARFPNQPFVLDHLAKPHLRQGLMEPWRTDLRRLAEAPNVFCKASGLLSEMGRIAWSQETFRPYLDAALEAFGPERIMVGSDWPVCTVAGSYAEAVGLVCEYVKQLDSPEQEAVLGGNAQHFYRLEGIV